MHTLESFSVVATVLGAPRKVNFDTLSGLTVAGVSIAEARAIAEILERGTADKPLRQPAPQPAPARNVPSAENLAKWGPARAQDPTPAPVSGEIVDTPPDRGSETPVAPSEPPSPADAPEDLAARHDASETPVENAPESQDAVPIPASPETPAPVQPQAVMPAEPTPQRPKRRKKGTKPPPRVEELRVSALPKGGDKHEDVEILDTKDHPDGRLLIRADGWRVKLDMNGKEIARMEGLLPDALNLEGIKTAEELEPAKADATTPDEPAGTITVDPAKVNVVDIAAARDAQSSDVHCPTAVMQTRSSREVVEYLLDNGTPKDSLVDVCLALKEQGAEAFRPTRDEEGVRRRVKAALAVLGRS